MTSDRALVHTHSPTAVVPFVNWGAMSLITLSWLYLNRATVQWLMVGVQELRGLNGLMLLAGLLLLVIQGVRSRKQIQFAAVPEFYPAPLILFAASGMLAIALRQWIDLEQLPVVMFLLGLYSLFGMFLPPATWKRGLAVAITIACILPFGIQFSTGLGFPARIVTAHLVEMILKGWHLAALSSEDIIVLDTGIAQVDLPCSGLKSLWTGTLFFLAMTVLEKRVLGLRWLGVAIANLAVLVVANIGRVLTLVVLTHVLQQPVLAEMMHVPLGVMSFIAACGITAMMLRWVPRRNKGCDTEKYKNQGWLWQRGNHFQTIPVILGLMLLMMVPMPTQQAIAPNFEQFHLNSNLQTRIEPLTQVEQDFFADYPGVVTQKQHFQSEVVSGTLLMVYSPTWRAHHAPELCLIGNGYELQSMQQRQFSDDLLGRWLSLDDGTRSAAYWFQSPQGTTDDFLTRLWSQVARQESDWILVTVLFDQAHQPTDSGVLTFLKSVQTSLQQTLS